MCERFFRYFLEFVPYVILGSHVNGTYGSDCDCRIADEIPELPVTKFRSVLL